MSEAPADTGVTPHGRTSLCPVSGPRRDSQDSHQDSHHSHHDAEKDQRGSS